MKKHKANTMKGKGGKTKGNTKKEKLELLEKGIDIRKKKAELKKEKMGINDLLERKQIRLDIKKLQLEKVAELRSILEAVTIDNARTLVGSEPFLIPILDEEEKGIVMGKMIGLIKLF
ncbi:hypothetical protein [Parasediminibacterium sp. JCM 36343]|uniref:hypothetical protein n=1 Tax=Parasediminibacterium sp. JCM 36343 TaxID=3374279 RepID=UPI00397DBC20